MGIDFSAYMAVDAGRVWGPSDVILAGHTLAGGALGLRGHKGSMQFDVALGFPLYRPEGFQAGDISPYVSATYQF
jgi:hemolysin activation/secretion protein